MINVQIVAAVVRLFSVWLATWALRNLPAYWVFDQQGVTFSQRISVVAFSVLMLAIAVALWFFPFAVAKKLVPEQKVSEYPIVSQANFQRLATSLLGLWTLIDAVPNGGYALVALSMRSAPLDGGAYSTITQVAIRLIIGIWLLFGAEGMWKFINKRLGG